jgi:hypothetical protein
MAHLILLVVFCAQFARHRKMASLAGRFPSMMRDAVPPLDPLAHALALRSITSQILKSIEGRARIQMEIM